MEQPKGWRFSHVYLRETDLLPDSDRMRRRLGVLIGATYLEGFPQILHRELGIPIDEIQAKYSGYWPGFIGRAELRDVLDAITIRHRSFRIPTYDPPGLLKAKAEFLVQVRRIFQEESVRYSVDEEGGVHFTQDIAFEQARMATVSALGRPRYQSVRASYDSAFLSLDGTPPDAKAALRNSFFATEALFRLMFPGTQQLSGSEVNRNLRPLIDRIYQSRKPADHLAQKQVASFIDWIDGAHFYRHEPGSEEPAQPPLELAVFMLSQASGFIRWLVYLDQFDS